VTGTLERRLTALEQKNTPKVAKVAKVKPPSPLEFIQSMKIVDNASGTLVPFTLWPSQKRLLREMVTSERLVVVKSRQLGCSYLALALMLYFATFEPAQLFLVARQSLEESAEAIHRLRVMNDSLPDKWRLAATTDNVFSLGLSNGARIRALSSSKAIGRGLSARYVIADEAAFWAAPEEQLAALEPGAHRLHVISTGNGAGDFFSRLYMQALTSGGRWRPLFLPWSAHPERNRRWYDANVTRSPSPSAAKREYPSKVEDAFAAPGGAYFERFSSQVNVRDVAVVPTWKTYRGCDFGYRHPGCVWVQESPAGQPFVVAELHPDDLTTAEFVDAILRVDATLGLTVPIVASYVDPAGGATNVQTATSEVEQFRRAGLRPVSRSSTIRDGCTRMVDAISDPQIPLVVSTKCPWLIQGLQTIRPDRLHSDVYDEGSPYTHVLDSVRYALVNRVVSRSTYTAPDSHPLTGGLLLRQQSGQALW
jgi:hypothetical protein